MPPGVVREPVVAGRGYSGRVPTAATITELDHQGFIAKIDVQLAIYGEAMDAAVDELPGRRTIMERHARNPGLRALAAIDEATSEVVGFSYGFRGLPGQWWHDVVMSAIAARSGRACARDWLEDALEIAEVHVRPAYQARGIGRRLVLALTQDRPERTALLSTRDAATPARKLYRSLGFTDLLTDFLFPGGGIPYAVMGAPLPLPGATAPGQSAPPGPRATGQPAPPGDSAAERAPSPRTW
jgi:ribosomal protein S18 acetylase RimI-like enzyme